MKLQSPKLPPVSNLQPITASQVVAEASLEQAVLASADLMGVDAKHLSIDEVLLEKVTLIEARLEKLNLRDARLNACDLSAATCTEGSLIRVHMVSGRMTGVDLARSTLQDVVFEDCKLDMANFRFARLTRVRFINCMMTETDFQVAQLTDVEFQDCHMEKVEFDQSKNLRVDARGSQLYDIRGWRSLRGLGIDSAQLAAVAPQLALELGLKVHE